jgi:hypothetical protein
VDTVEERKISCPCQESNPGYPFVAFYYNDRAIPVHFNKSGIKYSKERGDLPSHVKHVE